MNDNVIKDIELMEGRTFIIGRRGHIYIDSSTASKHHAEIKIIDGRIYLCDLDSTNGTYLLKNKKKVSFEKGYIDPLQSIVIGGQEHIVQDLLSIAAKFAASDDTATQVSHTNYDNKSKLKGAPIRL